MSILPADLIRVIVGLLPSPPQSYQWLLGLRTANDGYSSDQVGLWRGFRLKYGYECYILLVLRKKQ